MNPMICIVLIVVTLAVSIYYFVTHKLVCGECLDAAYYSSAPGCAGGYYCHYRYQFGGETYKGGGVSTFKHKVGSQYKIFINPKKPDKVMPFNSVMELLACGLVILTFSAALLVTGQMSF